MSSVSRKCLGMERYSYKYKPKIKKRRNIQNVDKEKQSGTFWNFNQMCETELKNCCFVKFN